jgi:copper chaperone
LRDRAIGLGAEARDNRAVTVATKAAQAKGISTMATAILGVPDISCEHCERAIKGALIPIAGVQTVSVDIPGKQVQVEYDQRQVSVDRMKEVLQEED